MATILDFRRLYVAGDLRRFYFLCGEERILVEECVDALRARVDALPENTVSLYAGEVSDAVIWSEINQYPLDVDKSKFIVIRDAEKIKSWQQFEGWILSRQIPKVFVVMVSNDLSWPTNHLPEVRERIIRSGRLVECNLAKDADRRQSQAVDLVRGWGNITPSSAEFLLDRVGYDLVAAKCLMRKVRLLKPGAPVTDRVIEVLVENSPSLSFTESLIAMKKTEALEALAGLSPAKYSEVIGKLDYLLGVLGKINKAQRVGRAESVADLSKRLDMNRVVVGRLLPYARHYDLARVKNCASVLMLIDSEHKRGAEEGLMEMLVTAW